jgi:hypothetical protein
LCRCSGSLHIAWATIDHNALDDLEVDFLHLLENVMLGQLDEGALVPENGWDEITKEFTEHGSCKTTNIR